LFCRPRFSSSMNELSVELDALPEVVPSTAALPTWPVDGDPSQLAMAMRGWLCCLKVNVGDEPAFAALVGVDSSSRVLMWPEPQAGAPLAPPIPTSTSRISSMAFCWSMGKITMGLLSLQEQASCASWRSTVGARGSRFQHNRPASARGLMATSQLPSLRRNLWHPSYTTCGRPVGCRGQLLVWRLPHLWTCGARWARGGRTGAALARSSGSSA
jgi:hypothetical protein